MDIDYHTCKYIIVYGNEAKCMDLDGYEWIRIELDGDVLTYIDIWVYIEIHCVCTCLILIGECSRLVMVGYV